MLYSNYKDGKTSQGGFMKVGDVVKVSGNREQYIKSINTSDGSGFCENGVPFSWPVLAWRSISVGRDADAESVIRWYKENSISNMICWP